jgi:broad specificity phosphatase PhoE
MTDPDASPPGGESLADLAARLDPVLALRLTQAGTLLAVTHPAVIRLAAVLVLGAPLPASRKIDIQPLSLTDLRSDGKRWHLRSLGVPGRSALR